MEFWELTVPTTAETTEGLTNFLWEQGALGVVEEETPSAPPRLRAFYAASVSSTALLGAVEAYRAGCAPCSSSSAGTPRFIPSTTSSGRAPGSSPFPRCASATGSS
jgi:hypothetical protein